MLKIQMEMMIQWAVFLEWETLKGLQTALYLQNMVDFFVWKAFSTQESLQAKHLVSF